jgi:hypothetical protein
MLVRGRAISGANVARGESNMDVALPFFLLGLPLVLAAYDLGRVRPEGTFGGLPWKNLTSSWARRPYNPREPGLAPGFARSCDDQNEAPG